MKHLNQFILEKFKINKDTKIKEYIQVKSLEELKKIVQQRYDDNHNNIDLTDIDISSLKSLEALFDNFVYVETINISNWDTSNIENTSDMFNGCNKLKEIKGIEDLDVSNIEETDYMFNFCIVLKKLDLSKWNVSKLVTCKAMFNNCQSLEEINISWNTKQLTNVKFMFKECYQLKKVIGLDKWDISNIKHKTDMFKFTPLKTDKNLPNWALEN